MTAASPHPLSPLSQQEVHAARSGIINSHGPADSLYFRGIYLCEPQKSLLLPFLEAEHAGKPDLESSPRPPRRAISEYSVINGETYKHYTTVVDVVTGKIVSKAAVPSNCQPYFCADEFFSFEDACLKDKLFQEAMSEFALPDDIELIMEPWPYGGLGHDEPELPRYMVGLLFGRPKGNQHANHYGYPIPLMPLMDWRTKEVLRIIRLPTGGSGDGIHAEARKATDAPRKLFEHSLKSEYVPELLDVPLRTDLKPINITQPEGASFSVHPDGLVEWQKWRFRLGVSPREGAVLHDVCYDGRPVMYRLSFSEMTVAYADPRPPFHRKQPFDFGDVGVGRNSNSLELGCDCLGAIHYVDSMGTRPDGSSFPHKSVVCIHEQDNGILWKHTNYRTSRPVVVRNRELVVQFIGTLANYEYVFSYKLDLAGGIAMETRATGVVSVAAIDQNKTSSYGAIVSPGVLAHNHQHIFAVRIDPAIDSYKEHETRVVVEESVGRKIDARTNPHGNLYEVERRPIDKPGWIDAEPRRNRILKMENPNKKNAISGRNVAYKLVAPVTPLLLADDDGIMARRARFAQHHLWVTGHRDGELHAAGEFTNQSAEETGGVSDMIKRPDWFPVDGGSEGEQGPAREGEKSSPVIWSVFGLTHNVRVEDWPVMPMESLQVHLKPNDFFNCNPALDVAPSNNAASVLVDCCGSKKTLVNGQPRPDADLE